MPRRARDLSGAGLWAAVFQLLSCLVLIFGIRAAEAEENLPELRTDQAGYHTPLAGEGFRAKILGREITIEPRDRRFVSAWDLGAAVYVPTPQNAAVLPIGSVYFWRHPELRHLFRAELSGVYNDIFFTRPLGSSADLEWVLTFNNYTVPVTQSELVEGRAVKSEELLWGYVRPGFGVGWRRQAPPGNDDNMIAVDLTLEPSFLFFDEGSKTAPNFVVPRNNFELRTHLQMRWDTLQHNVLELPHRGFAAGADLVYGHRTPWDNWGVNGSNAASAGRDYVSFTGYFLGAGGVPGIDSERHRLIGSVHGGVGSHLDRFSAPRVGGGIRPMGEEYGSTWRPILPGAVIYEFFPSHYLLAVAEYRWEPIFFSYLSFYGAAGWLDRLRMTNGETVRKDNYLGAVGARVTTGFFFKTRLQVAYNYNFSVVRDGRLGGNEITADISRSF